jgi:hypothetical protein
MSVASYTGAHFKSYLSPQQVHPNGAQHLDPRTTLTLATPSDMGRAKKRRRSSVDDETAVAGPSNPTSSSVEQRSGNMTQKRNSTKTVSHARGFLEFPWTYPAPNFFCSKPKHYGSSTETMTALATCFKPGGESSFSGTYTVANDPPISDKYRIQLVSNDIWRATGYRFTCVVQAYSYFSCLN